MLYFTGIAFSCFLLVLLMLKKGKTVADKILAVWMFVMVFHQACFYLLYSGVAFQYPHTLGIGLPVPVLHGVFLFLYVGAITQAYPFTFRRAWSHFLPFLMLVALIIPFLALPAAQKVWVFQHKGAGYEWYIRIQFLLIMGTGLVYIPWSLWLIRRHRRNIRELLSNTDHLMLRWLEYLSIGFGLIWVLVFFFDDDVVFLGALALVLFIGFFGINQVPVFYVTARAPAEGTAEEPAPVTRYAKSGLKDDAADRLLQRLHDLMDSEKLFRKNDLTLIELADRLDIHPNYLSQVINEQLQKPFYHYINTLRIEDFLTVAALPESKKYTLLSLAYESGFNSKSTFNKYFKHHTGKTPSEYFKSQHIEIQ